MTAIKPAPAPPAAASPLVRPAPTRRATYLPFAPPFLGEEEIAEVLDTLRSPWITTGPKTQRFEQEFAAYVGAPAALALNSCTAALHTALVSLGVGPGDEVITSTLTFAATVNVVEHVGARPVLVDVTPETLNLNPHAVAAAITPRTRAIIPVHYAGQPADLHPIRVLARAHNLWVVEDAAHALPADYRGQRIGAAGAVAAFSFYATKNITTAEGGMLTGDPELIDRARVISLHGMNRDAWKRYTKGGSWRYEVLMPGFKYNMTDIQAALGLQQLRKLEQFHSRRIAVAAQYTEAFSHDDALEVPVWQQDVGHAWHLYVLRLRPEALRIGRDLFIDELVERNIGVSVHFIPVHLHPYYRDRYGFEPQQFPVALGAYERMLSLPLHPRLTDRDVTDVIEAVLDVVRTYRR
jgi:dTDP-4-amino-4,6-dideoxygalactose transaminase